MAAPFANAAKNQVIIFILEFLWLGFIHSFIHSFPFTIRTFITIEYSLSANKLGSFVHSFTYQLIIEILHLLYIVLCKSCFSKIFIFSLVSLNTQL